VRTCRLEEGVEKFLSGVVRFEHFIVCWFSHSWQPKISLRYTGPGNKTRASSLLKMLSDKRMEAAILGVFSEMWIEYTQSHIRLP
jgi:hypothetical protein